MNNLYNKIKQIILDYNKNEEDILMDDIADNMMNTFTTTSNIKYIVYNKKQCDCNENYVSIDEIEQECNETINNIDDLIDMIDIKICDSNKISNLKNKAEQYKVDIIKKIQEKKNIQYINCDCPFFNDCVWEIINTNKTQYRLYGYWVDGKFIKPKVSRLIEMSYETFLEKIVPDKNNIDVYNSYDEFIKNVKI